MEPEIPYDCRYYTGYKPCGCERHSPRGDAILIIKLGAMGDVLRTTPILRALRARHDPCFITWLTDSESEGLLRHNFMIDRLLLWGHDASLIVQGQRFDLLLNFEKEPRALALDALVQAKEKRGFALHGAGVLGIHNAASEYALRLGIDNDLKFRRNRKTMPQILFEMAEMPFAGEEYVLEMGPVARAFAAEFARQHGLGDGGRWEGERKPGRRERLPVVGLNTGCGAAFPTKQWPLEHFASLAESLHAAGRVRMLLLGGAREREFNAELMRRAPAGAIVEGGCDNSLEQFMGLVGLCDVVVSADSLAMHLGIALRKKVVALLGPTSQSEIELYGRGEILAADLPCLPCYCTRCTQLVHCMAALEPQRVFEAIFRML